MNDVVVIGGGLAGSAIGYCCAALGLQVLVLERASLGAGGATRHSRGIVRAYDPDPELMRWGFAGVAAWHGWDAPGPRPFRPCGVLYLLAEENVAAALAAVAAHAGNGYPIEVVDGAAVSVRFPALARALGRRAGQTALFEPRGGYCEPRLAAVLYGHGIRERGGAVLEGVEVRSLGGDGDGALRVHTASGTIEARLVVLAAGAAAGALLPSLGLASRSIPLSCFHVAGDGLDFCLIDEVTKAYWRPEPPQHLYCGGAPFSEADRPEALPDFTPALHDVHRGSMQALLDCDPGPAVGNLMGHDGYTGDFRPLLGFTANHPRLCLATGFSGRGAKYIPAAARMLAGEIRDRLEAL